MLRLFVIAIGHIPYYNLTTVSSATDEFGNYLASIKDSAAQAATEQHFLANALDEPSLIRYTMNIRNVTNKRRYQKAMNKPALVILAAGMGSRYGGLKQMDPMDPQGHAIIDYSIYDAKRAGFGKIVFIIKKEIEKDFKETIGKRVPEGLEVCYAYQEVNALPEGYSLPEGRVKPWGTAHAVLCAKPFIQEPFAVINADDYYGVHGFQIMADFLTSHEEQDPAPFAMVGYHLGNTVTDNGYVSRGICEVDDNHQLISITERTHIEKREDHAEFTEDDGATWTPLPFDQLVSMNFFGFQPMIMDELETGFPAFLDQALAENPLKGEYFIPSVASDLLGKGKATMEVLVSKDQWYGVTYPEDKENVMNALQSLKDQGVYPQNF